MPLPRYTLALLALALCLTGCTGNYKYSDDQYRPLGEPQAVQRGN
ncbi:type VI secretion protein [Pseudomonas sp.]|nr:type VI secretion protein [Pseudomonas sp.]MDX1367886.1 type VI secretion protein [Pseudomonas sp.]